MNKMPEQQVLGFIKRYIRKNNISPSTREIQSALGIPSLSTTHKMVESLVAKNLLHKQKGAARGLTIPTDTYDCTINLKVHRDKICVEVWKGNHMWETWDVCIEDLKDVEYQVTIQVTGLCSRKLFNPLNREACHPF